MTIPSHNEKMVPCYMNKTKDSQPQVLAEKAVLMMLTHLAPDVPIIKTAGKLMRLTT